MGLGGRMYKYLTDVQFIKKLTHEGTKLTQALGHQLKIDYDIGTYIMLVGSAKRKMITQNEKGDVDMDYNLVVIKSPINNGKDLKEAVRKSFNKVLKKMAKKTAKIPHHLYQLNLKVLTNIIKPNISSI